MGTTYVPLHLSIQVDGAGRTEVSKVKPFRFRDYPGITKNEKRAVLQIMESIYSFSGNCKAQNWHIFCAAMDHDDIRPKMILDRARELDKWEEK